MRTFDLIVVGAGTAGLSAARAAKAAGRSVGLVEGARPGGDCTFYGCVPSKTMIEAARRVHAASNGADYGFSASVAVDFTAVMRRVRATIELVQADESPDQLDREGIELVSDFVRFNASGDVETSAGELLTAPRVVIATGGRAAIPAVDGLADVPYLTNETIFDLTELPGHLIVLGGGPIGCEIAQTFRRLGSEVTLLQRPNRLLPKDDLDAALIVQRSLERDGVDVRLGVQVTAAGTGPTLTLGDGSTVSGTHLLVCAGREARTDSLGLEAVGI